MLSLLKGLEGALRSRGGVTAIEYGLIAGLLALALVGTMSTLGTTLNSAYTGISTTISTAGG